MKLIIKGHVPTKKNVYSRRGGSSKGMFKKAELVAMLQALEWQMREQYKGDPLENTKIIKAKFFVRDGRADLDGKYTTIQDSLVNARVIRNDSIARVKEFHCEAVMGYPEERVELELY